MKNRWLITAFFMVSIYAAFLTGAASIYWMEICQTRALMAVDVKGK